jgi:hypothetical protein
LKFSELLFALALGATASSATTTAAAGSRRQARADIRPSSSRKR